MDIRHYLSIKGLDWSEAQRGNGLIATLNCPFCDDHEKKFAISLEDGAFNCLHLNKCGVKGSWWDFQKRMGDKPQVLDKDKKYERLSKPVYKEVKTKSAHILNAECMAYLQLRGFKTEIIEHFKLRQNKEGNAIMYPFYKNGKLVNIKYRSIKEKKFWNETGGEPTLFNRDNVTGETLYITEGQDDCIALRHYGIDGVSVPSGVGDTRWVEHEWEYLDRFKTIVLILDNDKAGNDAVLNIATRLGKWRCFKIELPCKDVNECLTKNISHDEFYTAILNPVEFDDKVKKAIDYLEDIVAFNNNKQELYGIPIKFPGLQDILRGWRPGETTIWTGKNGGGKSTALNLVLLDLLDQEQSVMIASLEMAPKHYIRSGIIQYCKKSEIGRGDIENTLSKIGNNWFIYNIRGTTHAQEMIDTFAYIARKYGVKSFIIDSLMKITFAGHNELQEQKEFMSKITDFAHEYECHVHLVAHPRKGFKDSDQPDKVDVSGASGITDAADNVIVFYRFTTEQKEKAKEKGQDIPDALMSVKKNRTWGTEDIVKLRFDEQTKRFYLFNDASETGRYKNTINPMGYIHD